MNSAGKRAVRARIARLAITLACVAPGCADGSGLGCDEAAGGAVELSWSLEATDGQRIDRCDDVRIENIRLFWGGGTDTETDVWPCNDGSGVTNFVVPAGATPLWVEPECIAGHRLLQRSFEAPAPVVRSIEAAELVTLNAVLITVENDCDDDDDDDPTSSCTCVCGALSDRCTDIEPLPVERDGGRPSPAPALRGPDPHAILSNPGASVF